MFQIAAEVILVVRSSTCRCAAKAWRSFPVVARVDACALAQGVGNLDFFSSLVRMSPPPETSWWWAFIFLGTLDSLGVNFELMEAFMSEILSEVLRANAKYAAAFGDKAKLALPPGRRFTILTCMDARLDPAKYAGLAEGDAHVIRNAGGRASDDALRSLVISYKLLGTREWFVIHHTDCGMLLFTNDDMRRLLASSLKTASFDGKKWSNPHHRGGHSAGHFIKWHTIKNQETSVEQDVRRIREHPLVPANVP